MMDMRFRDEEERGMYESEIGVRSVIEAIEWMYETAYKLCIGIIAISILAFIGAGLHVAYLASTT